MNSGNRATPPKKETPLPPSGPQTDRRPPCAERNPDRAQDRDRRATTTARARRRFGRDLLVSPPRLAAGRSSFCWTLLIYSGGVASSASAFLISLLALAA